MCKSGYYGKNGMVCTICPAGQTCPGGNAHTFCPANSWSDVRSRKVADCTCNAGYMGTDPTNCQMCPGGSYCPGDGVIFQCPANSYALAGATDYTWSVVQPLYMRHVSMYVSRVAMFESRLCGSWMRHLFLTLYVFI